MFSISSRLRQFSKTCNYPIYLESFLYQNKIHGSIRKLYPMKICHLKSCPLLFKYSLGTYQRRYSKSRIYKMWIFSHPTIRLILLEPLIFPRAIYTFMLSSCSNLIGRSSSSSWLFFRSGLLRHHHWLYPPLPDCRSISSSLLASVYSGSPLISQHFASWKKKKNPLFSLKNTPQHLWWIWHHIFWIHFLLVPDSKQLFVPQTHLAFYMKSLYSHSYMVGNWGKICQSQNFERCRVRKTRHWFTSESRRWSCSFRGCLPSKLSQP